VSATPVSSPTHLDLFDMMQAYKKTSLLRAGLDLGVFDVLAAGPGTVDDVAQMVSAHPRGTRILLNALAAIGLLEVSGGQFRLSPDASRHLVSTEPGYVGGMARVFASDWEWDALKDLSAAVRQGGTVQEVHAETPGYAYWEDFAWNATTVAEPTARLVGDVLAPWSTGRDTLDVLDVACGHGVYGYTLAANNPQARVWSLDWPNVLAITERHAKRLGVRERAHFIPGDMFEVPLGGPYDLVLVTNVTHHFSEEKVTGLLTRLGSVVKPGGRVVIVGFVVGDAPPAQDPAPHLFSVLMLAWTFEGESHSVEMYNRALTTAGLTEAVAHVTDLPFRILVAERR
jgi:2-polyprenyl-3-methyl-5-hydroxy-6-metoxy-1,4-benzoquinol methylase